MNVLVALMSPDNGVRSQAETQFSHLLDSNFSSVVDLLVNVLSDAAVDTVVRSFAAILLRRAIEKHSAQVTGGLRDHLQNRIFHLWAVETNATLLRRMSHVLAQLACTAPWPQLLPMVISRAMECRSVVHSIAALNLLEILTDYCPDQLQSNLPVLGQFLGNLISSSDSSVKLACAKATCACIVSFEDDDSRNSFREALPVIVNIVGECLSAGEEEDASSIIDHLVTIASLQPNFFKSSVDLVASSMLMVANASTMEFSTRSIALELLVTLAETAPALARRCTPLIDGILPVCMMFMADMDETEQSWCQGRYTEELDDGDYALGEEALERLAAGLGGRTIASRLLPLVQEFSSDGNWKRRRAAVAALARFAEGAASLFKDTYLQQSQAFVGQALADPSSIVRFQAIQTIGRFGSLFPDSVPVLIDQFLPRLIALLGDSSQCEKVRGHAAASITSLLNPEHCEAENLQQHLDSLLRTLVVCLQTCSQHVQGPCLTLLGAIAAVSEDAFAPYYAAFMPGIKNILVHATSREQGLLRGKAIECAGLLGEAVGVEAFAGEAMELMSLLTRAIEMDKEEDFTFDYLLPACARIAKALEGRFEPFLAVVMGPLLAGAARPIDFSMEDVGDDDAEEEVEHNEDTGTESAVINIGGGVKKRVTLNTHAVQQKQQAARLLYEMASAMKGQLKNYISPCFQVLLPMLTDKHSADIRASAALAVAKCFDASLDAAEKGLIPQEHLASALSASLGGLLDNLKSEINSTTRACVADALRDVLESCYYSCEEGPDGSRKGPLVCPDLSIANAITPLLLSLCRDSVSRRLDKEKEFASNEGLEEEDRKAFEDELEEEEDFLTTLVDALGHFLKLHREAFMPTFDSVISPAFAPFLDPSQLQQLQVAAVCMIDDAIEFGGQPAGKYISTLLPILLRNVKCDHNVLRQSSSYGIAQSLRFFPEICIPHLNAIVSAMMQLIQDPSAREEDHEGTTENAVYAFGLICGNAAFHFENGHSSFGGIGIGEIAASWLAGLPLRADEQEAKYSHRLLCDLVERANPAIVGGSAYNNMPRIMAIFGDILQQVPESATKSNPTSYSCSLAHHSTVMRIIDITQQYCSSGALQGLEEKLTESQKSSLQRFL